MRSLFVIDSPGRPLADALQGIVRGAVRFSDHDRLLYATDASIYQVTPLGVVTPLDSADIVALMRYCHAHRVPILPRGGGTSLAGQCVNEAVVIDCSPHLRRLLSVDVVGRTCEVEPGIGVDELNRQLVGTGLFFAPDPATAAHCAIGGCIGNNAAGSRSIRYGRTSENVAAIELVLGTGEQLWLGPGAGQHDPIALRLAHGVAEICRDHAQLIRERFPKTLRRNAGYGLDLILQQLDAGVSEPDLDLTGLICGSEGTLGIVTRARLKLHPVLPARGLAIVSFATLEQAIDAVVPILRTEPTAIELLDDVVLSAARGNNACRNYLRLVPNIHGQPPEALLYIEFQGDSRTEIDAGFARLHDLLASFPGSRGEKHEIATYVDPASMAQLWALRKAGEPLLHGMPGNRTPQTFVEDNAVPVEQLSRFVREFKQIVQRHGTQAAYYAHASVGVLHVRPMVDLHADADRAMMRSIAVEVADLARICGGVMSGEHGDGRIRGPLLERFYGPQLMAAFAEVKRLFDPNGILNPGNIVGAGSIESITQRLRTDEVLRTGTDLDRVETFFDYSDQHGFRGAVEQCNGAGVCRKTTSGTMCPSYHATLDERHATRGRGNALRLAISGQTIGGEGPTSTGRHGRAPKWNDAETLATLDLCLSCKACKSECPSNVDVARLKAEYLAQSYRAAGRTPLKARLFGHIRQLNEIGAIWPGLANAIGRSRCVRAMLNRMLHLAPQRSLPPFGRSLYGWLHAHRRGQAGRDARRGGALSSKPIVVLYADCFATYNEPHVGQAAVRVLEAFGYEVRLPAVGCCGRAMISTGLLRDACWTADDALLRLRPLIDDPRTVAVVACEPSCVSAIVDDWLQLKLHTPLPVRLKLAAMTFQIEAFLEQRWDQHPQRPTLAADVGRVLFHGHCHQKALWGQESSVALLRRFAGDRVTALTTGCCGMAGSFGYDADKYGVSMRIGEQSLFPPIRAAMPDTTVCAPGTSCRHQIHDGTGRTAIHPIEWIAVRLNSRSGVV